MTRVEKVAVAVVGVLTLILPARVGWARSEVGQSNSAPMVAMRRNVKMTEDVYKNIQVLRGMPADQLNPTMRLVAISLGVQCNFCHVEGAEDQDDKPQKQTARQMIRMMLAMNKDSFNGRVEITCYTCHRGSPMPVETPLISEGSMRPSSVRPYTVGRDRVPTADQLLDKYLEALGGMDALQRVFTRISKGKSQEAGNIAYPFESYAKAPDKRLMVVRMRGNPTSLGYAGSVGWTASAALNVRDMPPADLESAKLEDDLYLAWHIKQLYSDWVVGNPETVADREAYVLDGTASGRNPIRLYLDQQTGVLLRMIYFTELPLGRLPTQMDYSDYRVVDDVRVPFRIIIVRPTSRTTIQLDQVEQNGPIDESMFAKPAAPPSR